MIDLDKLSLDDIQKEIVRNPSLRAKIIKNMQNHGGSFVQSLARCMIFADNENLVIIAEAFMKYMLQYQPNRWKR